MTHPDFDSMPGPNHLIEGTHADVILQDEHRFGEYLEATRGHLTLYDAPPNGIGAPIENASIDYMKQDSEDLELTGSVELTAKSITLQEVTNWQRLLSDKMRAALIDLDVDCFNMSHQANDFYAKLDDNYAVHVQFGSSIEHCHVILNLEGMTNLYFASQGEWGSHYEDDEHSRPHTSAYDAIKMFSGVWSLVIDTVVDEFGEVKPGNITKPQLLVGIPMESKRTIEDIVEEVLPRPLEPSEIEQTTSLDDSFNLIGGLTTAKTRLMEIATIFEHPEAAQMYGIQGSHFLLYGPPGTGKTSLARAFSKRINATFRTVKSSDIVETWVGNSGKNINMLFDAARSADRSARIVLFFDEFEALAGKGESGTTERQDVRKQLGLIIDDITENHPNIIVAAAMNADLADIEPSLIRSGRLETIGTPLPNEIERADIWGAILARSILAFNNTKDIDDFGSGHRIKTQFNPYGNDIQLHVLAEMTEGMTGSDFNVILERARTACFRTFIATGEKAQVDQAAILYQLSQFGR